MSTLSSQDALALLRAEWPAWGWYGAFPYDFRTTRGPRVVAWIAPSAPGLTLWTARVLLRSGGSENYRDDPVAAVHAELAELRWICHLLTDALTELTGGTQEPAP